MAETEPNRTPTAPRTSRALNPSFYKDVYRASPTARIKMIRDGMLATDAELILSELSLPRAVTYEALKLSVTSVDEKADRDDALTPAASERLFGMAKMIGQLETMIDESGNPEGFDAAAWIARWFEDPLPALGGLRPVDLLDTMEGQALVSDTLARIQSGAYA